MLLRCVQAKRQALVSGWEALRKRLDGALRSRRALVASGGAALTTEGAGSLPPSQAEKVRGACRRVLVCAVLGSTCFAGATCCGGPKKEQGARADVHTLAFKSGACHAASETMLRRCACGHPPLQVHAAIMEQFRLISVAMHELKQMEADVKQWEAAQE